MDEWDECSLDGSSCDALGHLSHRHSASSSLETPGGYLSGLTFYRMNETAHWVRWFAGTLEKSAAAATSLVNEIESLMATWRAGLTTRAPRAGEQSDRAQRSGKCWKCCPSIRSSRPSSSPTDSRSPTKRRARCCCASNHSPSSRRLGCTQQPQGDRSAGGRPTSSSPSSRAGADASLFSSY